MSEVKYDAVFGDQSLFNNAPEDAVLAVKDNSCPVFYSGVNNPHTGMLSVDSARVKIAMRRIIKTPVWTVADQLECRMPEVGAKFRINGDLLIPPCNDRNITVTARYRKDNVYCVETESGELLIAGDVLPSNINPIETPAEKAQRLEDEWVNKAWGETAVFAGVTQDEHDRLRIHLRHIYRAQLSGELAAPKGGE